MPQFSIDDGWKVVKREASTAPGTSTPPGGLGPQQAGSLGPHGAGLQLLPPPSSMGGAGGGAGASTGWKVVSHTPSQPTLPSNLPEHMLSTLPFIGGGVGAALTGGVGILPAIAGAVLGGGGGSFLQQAGLGMLGSPEAPQSLGEAGQRIFFDAAQQGVSELGGQAVTKGLGYALRRFTPEELYHSALMPPVAKGTKINDKLVKAGLEEEIPISREGLEKAGGKWRDLNQQIEDTIRNKPPITGAAPTTPTPAPAQLPPGVEVLTFTGPKGKKLAVAVSKGNSDLQYLDAVENPYRSSIPGPHSGVTGQQSLSQGGAHLMKPGELGSRLGNPAWVKELKAKGYDPWKDVVGFVDFKPSSSGSVLTPGMVNVAPNFRRMGIASNMYDRIAAEAQPGQVIGKGGMQRPEGQAFRASYDISRVQPTPPGTVSPQQSVQGLGKLRSEWSQGSGDPAYQADINRVESNFLTQHPEPMEPMQAQAAKKGLYKEIRQAKADAWKGGTKPNELDIQAKQTIAQNLKDQLNTMYPDVQPMNLREGGLIELENAIDRAVTKESNKKITPYFLPFIIGGAMTGHMVGGAEGMGLGAAVGGLGFHAVRSALEDPAKKSALAIMLYNAGEIPAAKALLKAAPYVAPTGIRVLGYGLGDRKAPLTLSHPKDSVKSDLAKSR